MAIKEKIEIKKKIFQAAKLLIDSKRLVVFTGADLNIKDETPDFKIKNAIESRIKPKSSHLALAELFKIGKIDYLITQNIDELLSAALKEVGVEDRVIGRILKLNTNFEDKFYPYNELYDILKRVEETDVILMIGISCFEYPATILVHYAILNGAKLIIINLKETLYDYVAYVRFFQEISDVLPLIVEVMKNEMNKASIPEII